MICYLCGKKLKKDEGNNPYPLCAVDDYTSECCNECNAEKVITARLLKSRYGEYPLKDAKVGDLLIILWLCDDQDINEHALEKGIITNVENNKIYGTWGNFCINSDYDSCIIIPKE